MDNDVIIIGGGPAGLTAGLYLARYQRQVLLLEKELMVGSLVNIDWIEDYPGFPDGVAGAQLIGQMASQARQYGLQILPNEVTSLELYRNTRSVRCADGSSYTAKIVIIGGGTRHKKLNVTGEDRLFGKGVFDCAMCDGYYYKGKTVIVCGGGSTGVAEAIYLAKQSVKIIILESGPVITASAILRERLSAESSIKVRTGVIVTAILGGEKVNGVEITTADGGKETITAEGVLVRAGQVPNTDYLKNIVPLDDENRIIVNEKMETKIPNVFAVGDIRSGSSMQIISAAGDGAAAAVYSEEFLRNKP